jgi:uncharacterized protein YceH (UPF0502 family)
MITPLNPTDVRVLGALIEKEATTPDNYPLSLNGLRLACNQSSNRDPVMQLDDGAVLASTDRLRRQSLVRALQKSDSRVMKYSHLMGEAMELDAKELAVMCVLMLRGPQTLNEVKTRTERLAAFESLEAVEATLNGLIAREPSPLAVRLSRQPGQKELRYSHLLSGEVAAEAAVATAPTPVAEKTDRVAALEVATEELRREMADIKRQIEKLTKQFE